MGGDLEKKGTKMQMSHYILLKWELVASLVPSGSSHVNSRKPEGMELGTLSALNVGHSRHGIDCPALFDVHSHRAMQTQRHPFRKDALDRTGILNEVWISGIFGEKPQVYLDVLYQAAFLCHLDKEEDWEGCEWWGTPEPGRLSLSSIPELRECWDKALRRVV